ncbi:MAG: hypothetical protein K0U24_02680 [Gammaproteobacteria bacterium]|nr:hypothetical protein [Gammaproteobacteria bacterium]
MLISTALLVLSSYATPVISMDVVNGYQEELRVDGRQPANDSNSNEQESSSEDKGMSEPERAEEGRMVVPREYR